MYVRREDAVVEHPLPLQPPPLQGGRAQVTAAAVAPVAAGKGVAAGGQDVDAAPPRFLILLLGDLMTIRV